MTERIGLLSFKTLASSGAFFVPGQIIWRRKGREKYIEDLGKQQQTFIWFHEAAPTIEQPKHNTMQGGNRAQL